MKQCERVSNSHRQRQSLAILLLTLAFASDDLFAQSAGSEGDTRPSDPNRMVTQGLAKTVNDNLFKCEVELRNYRISAVGTITSDKGTVLTVPAQTAYQTGPKLADLFNECSKTTPATLADARLENVPVVEVDPDGEVITGYIVADNYFELYVNGKLIGVDPVPYTPFNSAIVRFKAKRPYTYALKAVDWEERLGLGMETNRGTDWHAGDGGLIARFSDGTVTDSTWKAQSFYIAPLARPDDVVENGGVHDTGKLGRVYPIAKVPACRDQCFAVHYPVPDDWAAPNFDDSNWPYAYEFTDDDVGVDHIPAYTRYPDAFTRARWIWSYNLVFDNLVLARKTVL
jgi:hypothetical protein